MKRFFNKISNIISYFPILWNDKQWDYVYINNLLLFKLEKTKNHFDKRKHKEYWSFGKEQSEERQKAYKALRICIEILKREKDDFYFNTYTYLMDNEIVWEDVDEEFVQLSESWKISSNMELFNKKEKLAERCIKRDEKLFGVLFSMYKKYWWV